MTRSPRARGPSFALRTCSAALFTIATGTASAQDDGDPSVPVSDEGIVPEYYEGNPTCADLGYAHEFKPQDADGDFDGGEDTWGFPGDPDNEVHVWSDGTYVNWDSTLGIDAVIVKGGPNANSYVYDPPEESYGDSGLASPLNDNTGKPYGLSHVNFCYDYELEVAKDAETSFDRDWEWTIDKTGSKTNLTLSEGQTHQVCYDVSVAGTYEDSNWSVSGTIAIHNPDPDFAADIESVTDVISGFGDAYVDCGVTFPYSLGSGETLYCSYSANLPNGDDRLNTATVEVCEGSPVGGGSGTAAVDFGDDPTNETDECIKVSDDQYGGEVGTTCDDTTFEYCLDVGPYDECGDHEFTNTASFETCDTGATGSDSWTVYVDVPCDKGCSLTQGYWKTHSELGPAPYDDTWALLSSGADTLFFNSGLTWYEQFWTAPAGNFYFNLSHQYAAAYLNMLNGASVPPAVQTAMTGAEALFNAQGAGDTTLTAAEKRKAQGYATTLASYNEGAIGPGHCDE